MLTPPFLEAAAREAGLDRATIIVRRLDRPGAEAVLGDPDAYLYPASMLKTPLCAAALALAAEGELDLQGRHEVAAGNMTANDKPSPLVPGYRATLVELIDLAITRSDNVATNMLYDAVGRDRATQLCAERFGLQATEFRRKLSGSEPLIADPQWDGVHRNRHSARDAATLFEAIARSQVPFAQLLRQTLARQEWNNKLSPGLQAGDAFAHKTGDTDEVTHDGGILDSAQGACYVVVVYTGMPSSEENNARFAPFMQRVRAQL